MFMWRYIHARYVHVQVCSYKGTFMLLCEYAHEHLHRYIRSCTCTFMYRYVHVKERSCTACSYTGKFMYRYVHEEGHSWIDMFMDRWLQEQVPTFMYRSPNVQVCSYRYMFMYKLKISNCRFSLWNHWFFYLSNYQSIDYRTADLRETMDLSISIQEIKLTN